MSNEPLNIEELKFILAILQVCAQRGAFQADEMSKVGDVYDRLRDFLIAAGAITVKQPEETNKDKQ